MNKKDHKYGTAEYSLCEAQEKIAEAFARVGAVRKEIGQIMPIDRIVTNSARLNGCGTSKTLSWYFDCGKYSQYGPRFTENDPAHIEKAYINATKLIESAEKEIEVWHSENLSAIANNEKITDDIKSFMQTVGIASTYSGSETFRGKTKSVSMTAGYLGDITRSCPVTDGYEFAKSNLKQHKESMTLERDRCLKKISEVKATKEKEDKNLRKIAKAMEIYSSLGLTEPYTTNEELIALVDEPAQEAWIKENYPTGETVPIKCCQECSEWTVGDHRCSCGNRRMYLEVEGNFFDGFSAWPAAN